MSHAQDVCGPPPSVRYAVKRLSGNIRSGGALRLFLCSVQQLYQMCVCVCVAPLCAPVVRYLVRTVFWSWVVGGRGGDCHNSRCHTHKSFVRHRTPGVSPPRVSVRAYNILFNLEQCPAATLAALGSVVTALAGDRHRVCAYLLRQCKTQWYATHKKKKQNKTFSNIPVQLNVRTSVMARHKMTNKI